MDIRCDVVTLLRKQRYYQDVSFMHRTGDIITVCTTGAYNYSMASNYNKLPVPPIIMITGKEAREVVRRQTYEDLIRLDVD